MRSEGATFNIVAGWVLPLLFSLAYAASSPAQDRPRSDPMVAPVAATSLAPGESIPYTTRQHFEFYVKTTYAPLAFAGPVAGAALSQWLTGEPEEWGQGFPGYGRRLLSGYSRQVIANTIALGVAFADGEDPRHYPTGRHAIWLRGLYSARQTFVSRKTSGGEMPDYSRIIGAYSAAFVANAWYPARDSGAKQALWRGSTALASNMVWQLFREFWPDLGRKLGRRH